MTVAGCATEAIAAARYFEIPEQRADMALTTFAQQADLVVLFPFDEVSEMTANRLVGEYELEEAATILLRGTGLTAVLEGGRQLVVRVTKGGRMKRKGIRGFFGSFFAAVAAGGAADGVRAQGESPSGLEEVIVTARYREESIQTTPISISAFSGEDLEFRNIENLADIGSVVPNAYFRTNSSSYGPSYTIGLRGLNQTDWSYSFEPTVGVYIDDIYHSTITGSDMDLVDLERIEVLRGPQGTLFGKNSIGGSIRLISRKPRGDNSGSVQLTVGDYDRLELKAVGDFSLVEDKLFARVVGVTKEREGYGASLDFTCEMIRRGTPELAGIGDGLGFGGLAPDGPDFDSLPDPLPPIQVPVGSDADNAFSLPASRSVAQDGSCELGKLGGTSSQAGRLMLRYLPTDRLDINFSADMYNSLDDPGVESLLSPAGGFINATYNNNIIYNMYGISILDDRFLTGDPYTNYATFGDVISGKSFPRDTRMDASGLSLVTEYRIGDRVGAKLILAKRRYDTEWNNDFGADKTPFALMQTYTIQEHESEQVELQFMGTAGANNRLEWTAGLFYFDSKSRAYFVATFEAFHYLGILENFVANDRYTTENKSAFVHLGYDISEKLRLSGGVRVTDENKTNTFDHQPTLTVDEPLLFGSSRTDWKLSLDYSLTDDYFLYTQVATGFTSEGAPPRIFAPGQLQKFPGEELVSYEIGGKFDFLDGRLRLNAAAYRSDYDPRVRQANGVTQCDAYDHPNPTPYRLAGGNCPPGTALEGTTGLNWFYFDNLPGKLSGYEIELTALPIAPLLINFSLGQNEYENDDQDPTSVDYLAPGYLFQPEYNASLGLQYTLSLGNGGTLTPRIDAFYQSKRHIGPSNAVPGIHEVIANTCPQQCIPAYTVMNARITYEPPNGDWRLSLAGTNVTDKFYWEQLSPEIGVDGTTGVITLNPAGRSGVPSRPREWSLHVQKEF
ncbi:MAG TPA: TonB-dependent receptor [Gammaproteobacteria bacterium]